MNQQTTLVRDSVIERIDLGFTELEIHENFVISRASEGETLTKAKFDRVLETVRPHFNGRVYLVFDEINAYAFDLDVLFALRDDQIISAICIVAYRSSTRLVLKSAKEIIKKPVFFFDNLEAATLFANQGQPPN